MPGNLSLCNFCIDSPSGESSFEIEPQLNQKRWTLSSDFGETFHRKFSSLICAGESNVIPEHLPEPSSLDVFPKHIFPERFRMSSLSALLDNRKKSAFLRISPGIYGSSAPPSPPDEFPSCLPLNLEGKLSLQVAARTNGIRCLYNFLPRYPKIF